MCKAWRCALVAFAVNARSEYRLYISANLHHLRVYNVEMDRVCRFGPPPKTLGFCICGVVIGHCKGNIPHHVYMSVGAIRMLLTR